MSTTSKIGTRIEQTPQYIWKKGPTIAVAAALSAVTAVGFNHAVNKWIDPKTIKVNDPWNPTDNVQAVESDKTPSNYYKAQGLNVLKTVASSGVFLSILSSKE